MRTGRWYAVAALFLLAGGLQVPAFALPRAIEGSGAVKAVQTDFDGGSHGGRDFDGGSHGGRDFDGGYGGHRGGVFVGPGFGWGWGWNNPWYWGPYSYPPPVVGVQHINYGTVQFKVKPGDTRVYVDHKYIGTVNDLEHHKAYMAGGQHNIELVAPDGRTADRSIYVPVGKTIRIEDTL